MVKSDNAAVPASALHAISSLIKRVIINTDTVGEDFILLVAVASILHTMAGCPFEEEPYGVTESDQQKLVVELNKLLEPYIAGGEDKPEAVRAAITRFKAERPDIFDGIVEDLAEAADAKRASILLTMLSVHKDTKEVQH